MVRRITAAAVLAAMLCTSTGASFDVNVNFDKDYIIEGENTYNVFGENNTEDSRNIQVISVKYENGEALDVEVSDAYTIAPESSFDIKGSFAVESGTDMQKASVRLFVWDGMSGIKPLTEPYSPNGVQFEYTLAQAATTSAGVYDENDRLIRTLWSAEEKAAGTHKAEWDGLDDNGSLMADGNYYINVMSHNVKHEMYTLVGNSSERITKFNMLSEYRQISDMSVFSNRMYYSQQYMENSRTWNYFNLDNCHVQAGWFEKLKKNKITIRNCTDGKYVYWLSSEYVPTNYLDPDAEPYAEKAYNNLRVFVAAYDPVENAEVIFEAGKTINNYWGAAVGHQSAISIRYTDASDTRQSFGDIAVQKDGNHIIMITGYDDFVRTINKTTGYVVKDTEINNPESLAVDNNDNIWVSYEDENGNIKLGLFSIDDAGALVLKSSAPESVLTDKIIALAVSPDGANLVVTYANPTAKVVSYKISDWSQNWSLGSGESYETDPYVYDDKFMFYADAGTGASGGQELDYSFLTFEDENTLWLGDTGNDRCFKYDLSTGKPVKIDHIYQPTVSYHVAVDTNNPSTIIHGHKEYEMVYDTDNPDAAWKLNKNWYHQAVRDVSIPVLASSTMSFIDGLTTLENGKTYFAATTYRNGKYNIYELCDKSLRNTEVDISGYAILDDGKMTLQKVESATVDGVSGKGFYQRYLEGTDDNDNPYWGEDVMVAFIPTDNFDFQASSNYALTETGILAEVNTSNLHSDTDIRDMRMGGIKAEVSADNDWLWKACPATSDNYDGDFPDDGALEVNAWYTWHNVYAYGRHLIAQYRGEGYRQYQANKFYHMYDNGLLIDMFGEATCQQLPSADYGGELVNGNGFNWIWVNSPSNPEDEAYTIQGGEAGMSGALIYKISGLSTIKEDKIPILWNSGQRNGLRVASYSATGATYSNRITDTIEKKIDLNGGLLEGAERIEITGYIEKPDDCAEDVKLRLITDGYAELYVDNILEAEGTGTINKLIPLSNDIKTKIKIVIIENEGVYNDFKFCYVNADEEQKDYPVYRMWTEPKVYEGKETVRNLLEGLPYDVTITETKAYGWDFTNWQADSASSRVVTAKTNVRNYKSIGDFDLDLSATIGRTRTVNETVYVERDLGSTREDLSSWEISANMMISGSLNGLFQPSPTSSQIAGERGRFIDILDVNDKIIARVYPYEDHAIYGNGIMVYQVANPPATITRTSPVTVNKSYLHDFTGQSDMKIYAKDGEITIAYLDGSITTTVYEEGALWNKPAKLRLTVTEEGFYSPHGETYETDFSKLTYTQYASEEMCKVTFYSDDKETILLETTVPRGASAIAPYAERDNYILSWSGSLSCVTEDMSVYAIYTPIDMEHDVIFLDENGMHLATLSGVYGETLNYEAPDKSGYVFVGWYTEKEGGSLADLTNRLEDITVYARYEEFAKALYDFETAKDDIKEVNSSTGAITAGTYSNLQGTSGFTNVEYYITYRTNGYLVTDEDTSSTVFKVNGSARSAGDYVRFDFNSIEGEQKFKVYYSAKGDIYNAAVGGFGMVYGTKDNNRVEVVKATCDNANGIAVWNSSTSSWKTIVPTTDVTWHKIEYGINLKTQKVDVYLDNALYTTVPFVNSVTSVESIEFNMQNNAEAGKVSRYYIDNVGTRGY